MMSKHNCRICGLYIDDLPWGKDGDCPTYNICPCCGVEFGNEDYSIGSIKRYREKWINGGAIWFDPKQKPNKWDMNKQLENISKDFL